MDVKYLKITIFRDNIQHKIITSHTGKRETRPRVVRDGLCHCFFLVGTLMHIPVFFETFLCTKERSFNAQFNASRAL